MDSNGNTIKLKKPFSFPKTLFPGRFLLKNKKKSIKLQHSMRDKKKKSKQLEISIDKFIKFNGTDNSLPVMLNLCSNFLHSQSNREVSIDEPDIQIFSPSSLLPVEDLDKATNLIMQYSSKVSEIVQEMKGELENCTREIENTFDQQDLNESVYELIGIVVHNGEVGSGQSYIYMYNNGIWKKYHDMNVTEVNEKQVMYDSLGEYGISAACCLIYSGVV